MLYSKIEHRVERILKIHGPPTACPVYRARRLGVYLIRQPTKLPCVDHVALLFDVPQGPRREVHVSDHGPSTGTLVNDIWTSPGLHFTKLPYIQKTMQEVKDFEAQMPFEYIPFVHDCRHHVLDLLNFCYGSEEN